MNWNLENIDQDNIQERCWFKIKMMMLNRYRIFIVHLVLCQRMVYKFIMALRCSGKQWLREKQIMKFLIILLVVRGSIHLQKNNNKKELKVAFWLEKTRNKFLFHKIRHLKCRKVKEKVQLRWSKLLALIIKQVVFLMMKYHSNKNLLVTAFIPCRIQIWNHQRMVWKVGLLDQDKILKIICLQTIQKDQILDYSIKQNQKQKAKYLA